MVAKAGKLPVPNFSAGGIATPADASLMMQLGAEAIFVGSGIFMKDGVTPLDLFEAGRARRSRSPRQGHRHRHHALQRCQSSRRSQRAGSGRDEGPGSLGDRRERHAADARMVRSYQLSAVSYQFGRDENRALCVVRSIGSGIQSRLTVEPDAAPPKPKKRAKQLGRITPYL